MKKISVISVISVFTLLLSCSPRDNPFDPDGTNPPRMITFSPEEISAGKDVVTMKISNFPDDVLSFHVIFSDPAIVVDSVIFDSGKEGVMTVPSDDIILKSIEIIATQIPFTGDETIAKIWLSNISDNYDELSIHLGEKKTVVRNTDDQKIDDIFWVVPAIN
jgi:hypothetical protein